MDSRHAAVWIDHRQAKVFHFDRDHAEGMTIKSAEEWLITGPGSAKDELVKHIRHHDHQLASRIIAVESADHPTDGQIVALARKFFKAADRMLG